MNRKPRRRSCQPYLAAGAGVGSAALIATSSLSLADTTLLPDKNSQNKHSTRGFDYSKIGYCGYRCDICPGQSDNKTVRRKMVDGWKILYGHTMYTEENIPIAQPCAGCKSKSNVADLQCQARPCARKKGVLLCADCNQFPCNKIQPLLADRHRLLLSIKGKDITLEEYKMSALQFESVPVLLRRMAEKGKMPAWVKKML